MAFGGGESGEGIIVLGGGESGEGIIVLGGGESGEGIVVFGDEDCSRMVCSSVGDNVGVAAKPVVGVPVSVACCMVGSSVSETCSSVGDCVGVATNPFVGVSVSVACCMVGSGVSAPVGVSVAVTRSAAVGDTVGSSVGSVVCGESVACGSIAAKYDISSKFVTEKIELIMPALRSSAILSFSRA